MKPKITLVICLALAIVIVSQAVQTAAGSSSAQCKELNNVNCYVGQNEGYFCSSKDQTKTETRWFYDKGHCKKFTYKGCNGNRNRFCTKESCERRCAGE